VEVGTPLANLPDVDGLGETVTTPEFTSYNRFIYLRRETVARGEFTRYNRFVIEAKLSKLQRWILLRALRGDKHRLEKVRIMADYFGLPLRHKNTIGSGWILVVDRQAIEKLAYNKAAFSMNRSLRRLEERDLIKVVSYLTAPAIALTVKGVSVAKEFLGED
jgi:hypothetical protein